MIVNADADVPFAAERVAWGGFVYSGQTCISVQRVYVHADVHDAFLEEFLPRVAALKAGDPLDEATDIGPLIDAGRLRARRGVAGRGPSPGAHRPSRAARTRAGSGSRPSSRTSTRRCGSPARRPSPRSSSSRGSRTSARRSPPSTAASSASRRGSSRATGRRSRARSTRSRSAGSSSTTSRRSASTTCPTAASSSPGFGREGIRYAIEEMTELKLLALNDRD